MTVHVIPVPEGMTPEEAWAEIYAMGALVEWSRYDPRFQGMTWAVVEVDDD